MDSASVSLVYLSVPVTTVFWLTYNIPLMVMFSCILWVVVFRANNIWDGGCPVKTTLAIPTITHVLLLEPESSIIRQSHVFHCTPRLVLGFMYLNYYRARINHVQHKALVQLLTSTWFVLYIVEAVSLSLVYHVPESAWGNWDFHTVVTVLFVSTGYFAMAIHTVLYKLLRFNNVTRLEKMSYFWKKTIFAINTSSLILVVPCYLILYRVFCLPWAHSAFSLCEYVIVFCNVAFRFTATWDFSRQNIMVARVHHVHHDVAAINGIYANNV